jgi:hypothetical protein
MQPVIQSSFVGLQSICKQQYFFKNHVSKHIQSVNPSLSVQTVNHPLPILESFNPFISFSTTMPPLGLTMFSFDIFF